MEKKTINKSRERRQDLNWSFGIKMENFLWNLHEPKKRSFSWALLKENSK